MPQQIPALTESDTYLLSRLTNPHGPTESLAAIIAEENARIAMRKAADHYCHCHDCGRFVPKARWVSRASSEAIKRGARPLCAPCFSEYDPYID